MCGSCSAGSVEVDGDADEAERDAGPVGERAHSGRFSERIDDARAARDTAFPQAEREVVRTRTSTVACEIGW